MVGIRDNVMGCVALSSANKVTLGTGNSFSLKEKV